MPRAITSGAIRCDSPWGERGEDQADAVERGRREPLDPRLPICEREVRVDVAEQLARLAVAEQLRRSQAVMPGAEPEQFRPDETRGAKDRNIDHAMDMHVNA